MKLLIATHNPGKLREYGALLAGLPLELLTLDEAGIPDEVDETGSTFLENACLKARAYARRSGLLTLADDSGLEVDALGGEPGVQSKRYAGPDQSDAARNEFLLGRLRDIPAGERTARFRCTIVLANPGGRTWMTEGRCEGEIAFDQRGSNGFGYDPVFTVAGDGRRMAELPPEEKNRKSHRAAAAVRARELLRRIAAGI
ncbi:MAG: RdgB/HAM1 family non-canonical purine NTP pyrophosphatase [Rudaea sp.]